MFVVPVVVGLVWWALFVAIAGFLYLHYPFHHDVHSHHKLNSAGITPTSGRRLAIISIPIPDTFDSTRPCAATVEPVEAPRCSVENDQDRIESPKMLERFEAIENQLNSLTAKMNKLEESSNELQANVKEMNEHQENESKPEIHWREDALDKLPSVLPFLIQSQSRTYYDTQYANCFLGQELVTILKDYMRLDTREEAVKIGQLLLDNEIIVPCGLWNKKFRDLPWLYSFRETLKHAPPPSCPTHSTNFVARLDFEVVEGFGLRSKLPLSQSKFSIELTIENQFFLTRSKTCRGPKSLAKWQEGSTFFIFQSWPILEISLWENHFFRTKRKIIVTQIPLWELPNDQTVEKSIQLDTLSSTDSCLIFRFKYSFLRETYDDGTALSQDLRPLSWLVHDPYYLYKPHLHYNRCGISDIFLKLPEDATSTEDRIEGTFEFFIPIPDGTEVELFVQKSTDPLDWHIEGCEKTSSGKVSFLLPLDVQKKVGRYPIRMKVKDDPNQMAIGSVFIVEPDTNLVCFDIDGTLTTGNEELIKQLALDLAKISYHTKLRKQSVAMTRWWWAMGYIPVYLSGRQGSAYNFTRRWLQSMGFPPGLIGHTGNHIPTLPIYSLPKSFSISGVGDFKLEYLQSLKDRGLVFAAGYGNTGTDIRVYENLEISKSRTFISGKFQRKKTVPVGKNFVKHIEFLDQNIPIASPAFPVDSRDW